MTAHSRSLLFLLAALVLGSALGIYYYLRVIFRMTQKPGAEALALDTGAGTRAVMAIVVAVILALGILPQTLMGSLTGIF